MINVKKSQNVIKLLLFFLVLVLLIPPSAFAEEGGLYEVKGYEDMGSDKVDLIISNVTKTVDSKSVDEELDAYFVTQSPTEITTVNNGAIFDVYKATKQGSNYVTSGEPIPFSGKVKIWVNDQEKTIDASELKNYEVEMPNILKGCRVTLTEPGFYRVLFRYEAIAGSAEVLIHIEGDSTASEPTTKPDTTAPAKATANPTASKVLVNGTNTTFDAYNINNNNYFKLRDLAKIVSGTTKQFEVTWDNEKASINLVSNKSYTAVGEEMSKGDGKIKNAALNTAKIYKDGSEIALTAYNINGNNYFKLRDIANAFNIGITWDGTANTIGIDTTKDYIVD